MCASARTGDLWLPDDELVEKAVRIRKRDLDPHERKRAARQSEAA